MTKKNTNKCNFYKKGEMKTMIHIHTDDFGNTFVDTESNGRLTIFEKDGTFYLFTELQKDEVDDYMYVLDEEDRQIYKKTYNELIEEIDAVSVFSTDDLTLLIKKLGEMRDEAMRETNNFSEE